MPYTVTGVACGLVIVIWPVTAPWYTVSVPVFCTWRAQVTSCKHRNEQPARQGTVSIKASEGTLGCFVRQHQQWLVTTCTSLFAATVIHVMMMGWVSACASCSAASAVHAYVLVPETCRCPPPSLEHTKTLIVDPPSACCTGLPHSPLCLP